MHDIRFNGLMNVMYWIREPLKFMFSKKATKIDKIFTVDLTLCSKCQIDGEDFVNFCGLLRKHELYIFHKIEETRACNVRANKN